MFRRKSRRRILKDHLNLLSVQPQRLSLQLCKVLSAVQNFSFCRGFQ